MDVREGEAAAYGRTTRLLMRMTAPAQVVMGAGCSATHRVCNAQAILIMRRDGLEKQARVLERHREELDAGAEWADAGWKNVAHYFDPAVGQGLRGWPAAPEECARLARMARRCWLQGDAERACFFLGAAVHLVQDLCVPHHARNIILHGHHAFEKWAEDHAQEFLVPSGGLYPCGLAQPGDWVRANARRARRYWPVAKIGSERAFRLVTSAMLPLAQRSSAGFFEFFFRWAGRPE